MTDPIVEEVRKYRDEHAQKFNYDLKLICEDLRKNRLERMAKLKNCPPQPTPSMEKAR